MPEAGGTTTQSGIYFQNSIAALYLGRLCDMRSRPSRERVIEVRVEAPEHVDDVVVTYADRHREWLQAKEDISFAGDVWKKLWHDFERQRWSREFSSDDRFVLTFGNNRHRYGVLREACLRAAGATGYQEWYRGLTVEMRSLAEGVRSLLTSEHQGDEALFALFSRMEVQIVTLEQIERDDAPRWMSPSSEALATLFRLLRDRCGGYARYRNTFRAPQLLAELSGDHGVYVFEPESSGAPAYRSAISIAYSRLEVPGTNLSGDVKELFLWPSLQEMRFDQLRSAELEDEDPRHQRVGARGSIDLRPFPDTIFKRAVVVAGAGFGKTALLTALVHRLSGALWLPVMVSLSELAEGKETVVGFLQEHVNRRFNVSVAWEHFCETGRAVILFDGLDELGPPDRRRVLDSIREFSARYPQVPWLLTVRDAKALSVRVDAKVLKIDAYDDERIEAFATAHERAGSAIEAEELLAQLRAHPDLRLLARIPLFLALLLATAQPSIPLPRNRGDLLERYLYVVFNPAMFKPTTAADHDPFDLRGVAQHLAFATLEQGKTSIDEWTATQMLRAIDIGSDSTRYITALVTCGLLVRSANRLSFPFPTVQEYLAACHLLPNDPDEIVQKFESSARRPWAQMLQFAVERHPEADTIIDELMAQENDAFFTELRLVGRCVVNGAQVSPSTRTRLGELLADAWLSRLPQDARKSIGKIIANGFKSPLPLRAREALRRRWGLRSGGDEIVTACKDPTLTRDVLEAMLEEEVEDFYLYDMQPAVDDIAHQALQLYVKRAKAERTTDEEAERLTYLMKELSREHLPTQAYRSVVKDHELPPLVRLAGHLLGPEVVSDDVWPLMQEVIRAPERNGRTIGWHPVVEALWRTEDATGRWCTLVCDSSLPERRREDILFALFSSPLRADERLEALKYLQARCCLTEALDHAASLLRAHLGDREEMDRIDDMLDMLNLENLSLWAMVTPKHRSKQDMVSVLRKLDALGLGSKHKVRLAGSLAFGLVGEVTIEGQRHFFSMRRSVLHSAAFECARTIFGWAEEHEEDVPAYLSLAGRALALGYEAAARPLAERLALIVRSEPERFQNFEFDRMFSGAISALDRSGSTRGVLSLDTLRLCVEASTSNTALRAMEAVVSFASQDALEVLLQLHGKVSDASTINSLEGRIEELAGRLGVRIVRGQGGKLLRA
jgi:hypothetical protein